MNLDKIKSVFPDFQMNHFNMFDKVVFLKWETTLDNDSWEEHTNLILGMTSSDNYKIFIEFMDVKFWRFRGNGQISGFYIKDMTVRGYENNSKYEVGDYEENEIEFYCSEVTIKSLEKMDNNFTLYGKRYKEYQDE